MATLPRAIQEQVDRADALLASSNAPEPQTLEPQPETQPEPVVEAPQPTPAPPAPAQPNAEETWEHRYRSLQGVFNKQVPTLQTQVQDLSTQLQTATRRLDEISKAKPPEPVPTKEVDPRDVEAFGEDLVGMVQRVAERMFGGVAKSVEAQFGTLVSRIEQIERGLQGTTQAVAASAEETFFTRLNSLAPSWEATNTNPAFLAWLGEVDPILGATRQAALEAAQSHLDVHRAAAIFQAWTNLNPPAPAPRVDPLERQTSPRSAASPAPTGPTPKTVITQAQIIAFYDDVAKGRYRGRDAEAAQIEETINAALAEGRVR
jgi:hypothetical protein